MFNSNNESMVHVEERLLLVTKARWIVIFLLSTYGFITAYSYLFYFHLAFDKYFNIIKFPLSFVSIMIVYNTFYHIGCLKYPEFVENHLQILIKIQIFIDILMATALIYLTGGVISRFWGLYILLTLELTYIFPNHSEVVGFGVLSGFMYTLVVWLEYFQILPYVNPFAHTGLVDSKLHLDLTYSFTGWFWVNAANLSTIFLSTLMHNKEKSTVVNKIIRDSQTGLFNRNYFKHELNSEIAKAQRYGHIVSLLMIDVDNFKDFNNCYGNKEGNRLIKNIAKIINANIKGENFLNADDIDVVCRYGFEEFTVILHDLGEKETIEAANKLKQQLEKNIENAFTTAERLRDAVCEISDISNSTVSISVGVASYPFHAKTADDLVNKANEALNEAKRKGKNKTVICSPTECTTTLSTKH